MSAVLDNFKTEAMPVIAQAIKRAENDATGNFGVRSMKTSEPGKVLKTSVNNNFKRWQGGKQPAPWIKEKPKKFVDFMQRRWAPIGAENDPDGLNKFWAGNVRSILRQLLGDEQYGEWERLNLVQQNMEQTNAQQTA